MNPGYRDFFMALPLFFTETYTEGQTVLELDETNSRHIVQVLRMQEGEALELTDGKGHQLLAEIETAHKKHCTVTIKQVQFHPAPERKTAIAIALLKNASRFEWFLEKATEIGISAIFPLKTERTEKQHFRLDRMEGILISALLQSRQFWLPELHEPMLFPALQYDTGPENLNCIAHCEAGEKPLLNALPDLGKKNVMLLIGPEGDFTTQEIDHATAQGCIPVSLGATRLRTETAALVGCMMLRYAG